jgi:mediator of RNA polymerase II transcription subunit 14
MDTEIVKTRSDMENAIRYRLRMTEIIPVEMFQHHIGIFLSFTCQRP